MATPCFKLFGKFDILRDGEPVHALKSVKLQELLSYLFLRRDRPQPREVVATALWGSCSTAKSKAYLRRLLWQLHSTLDDALFDGTSLLVVDNDWIQLNPHASYRLDVAEFEAAHRQMRGIDGWELDANQANALHEAIETYTSDLLVNWYHDWCLAERERLKSMYLMMLDKLVDFALIHQQFERGLTYGTRILLVDPAREHTHRKMMQLRYLAGNRTDAIRQYERCADALADELGVQPAKRTVDLYEQVCADRRTAILARVVDRGPSFPSPDGLPPDRNHWVREVRDLITMLRSHIQTDLAVLEDALHDDAVVDPDVPLDSHVPVDADA